ncbi:MAG: tRNA (adenosine(37)-N6)-threonylcarbamoyltransferase complex dimerization subunit type 1 TsaB [Micromonosporaceae bacterium]
MHVLVVDTATPAVTAALVEIGDPDVTVRSTRVTVNPRAHSELLTPAIQEIFAETGIGPGALAAVVAGVGPGPYTGLRVGLVTAAAFTHALSIPGYGVCSLDGIGAAVPKPGRAVAATDARRREIYWRVYESGVPITEPAVDQPAAAAEHLSRLEVQQGYGDGAIQHAEALRIPVSDQLRFPDPAALARVAADRVRATAPNEVLTPLYLRRPDAALPGVRKKVLR